MTEDDYKHFVCIVAGDNPDELMKEFDKKKEVEPYLVYKYKDAHKIRKKYLDMYEGVLNNEELLKDYDEEGLREVIDDLRDMTDNEFYGQLVEGLKVDEVTGDAFSTANKDGKWTYYSIGKLFSIPFLTKDGRETFKAKKGEIDWDKIHLANQDVYRRAWEMVMEGSKPANGVEEQIYHNMYDKTTYFKKFETKENYVISNTAFWGYAFVSDTTGWVEAGDDVDQFTWMTNYYDTFIKNLPDDTLLTIFECKR